MYAEAPFNGDVIAVAFNTLMGPVPMAESLDGWA